MIFDVLVGTSKFYLSKKIGQDILPNGIKYFGLSLEQYTKEEIECFEFYLNYHSLKLTNKIIRSSLPPYYSPEVDI